MLFNSPIGLTSPSSANSVRRALIEPDFEPRFWQSAPFNVAAATAPVCWSRATPDVALGISAPHCGHAVNSGANCGTPYRSAKRRDYAVTCTEFQRKMANPLLASRNLTMPRALPCRCGPKHRFLEWPDKTTTLGTLELVIRQALERLRAPLCPRLPIPIWSRC